MDVELESSSLVRPLHVGDPTACTKIWNSTLDLIIANMYVKTVYFFKYNGSGDFFSADLLKRAMSEALTVYYPMAGRLSKDADGRLEIICNSQGVLFVEARTGLEMQDLGEFVPNPAFLKLVPELDSSQDFRTWPLVIVQMTRFRCGGVCLGVGVEHHVADGLSAVRFLNSWSDCARGKPILDQPVFDRTCLKARDPPTPLFAHQEYQALPPPPRDTHQATPLQSRQQPVVRTFSFSNDFLRQLHFLVSTSCQYKLSFTSYELLASHIWKCVCEARAMHHAEVTKLLIAVDGRGRLQPPLPKGYFGNVIFTCCPACSVGEIVRQPSHVTAVRIHKSLQLLTDTYLRSAIDFLETQADLSRFVKGSHTFASPNLGLTSWAKLPMYDCDFGWGRPLYVGPAHIPFEGLAYLLGSPNRDGSLHLCISLESHHMTTFSRIVTDLSQIAAESEARGNEGDRLPPLSGQGGAPDVEKTPPTVACVQ